jgi:V/A-type H+-transporting ATPase subunit I
MRRIALVAPTGSLREVLVLVAGTGAVEIDQGNGGRPAQGEAARLVLRAGRPVPHPALLASRPDLGALDRAGQYDLLAGEAQLESHAAAAIRRSGAAALAGWIPAARLPEVAATVAAAGGALVPLPRPRGAEAPTLLSGAGARRSLTPLVQTYGTVPYADLDPTWLAWATYVLMFGMMFGDAGQGVLLIAVAAALRAGWPRWARRFRPAWLFVAGAGVAATVFGLLYGEFFGPTGLVPVIWLDPLSQPVTLLLAAVGIGAVLLAGAYVLGTVNRWREGRWPAVLYAPSGIAGATLFLGAGLAVAGWYTHQDVLLWAGAGIAAAALILALAGFLAGAGGGAAGVVQALVELGDMVIRLGSNVVSFTRLAAFGLTHAALGLLVWEGSRALWQRGGAFAAVAVAVFLAGTALAFSLEALVAAIQALRLEYYELFSRVFVTQGRPFRPWRLPVLTSPEGSVVQRIPEPSVRGADA